MRQITEMRNPATATPRNVDPAELQRALDTADFFTGLFEAALLSRERTLARSRSLPVVIVAGFLGAGKTTLMRHLLTSDHGLKIAAMVNDFAALNVDAELISEASDDITAFANGCVCCSLSGGVARGLADISARDDDVDVVLLEASGVSDPAAIAQVACTVENVLLDCIVTVVDAAATLESASEEDLLRRYVTPANIVLLNKTDLVSSADLDSMNRRLKGFAPHAQILRTVNCAVPAMVVFDSATAPETSAICAPALQDHDYKTVVLTSATPIDRQLLEAFLGMIPDGIIRMKGFLCFADTAAIPSLLQSVGPRWSLIDAPGQALNTSSLVVIGQRAVMSSPNTLDHFLSLGFQLPS